jgi:hypothetical protein
MDDPQEAWQLMVRCVVPRANHTLRTLGPSSAKKYADDFDTMLWDAAVNILEAARLGDDTRADGRVIAEFTCRMGGVGLRSAARTSPAAFWASWADTLPMMMARNPHLTGKLVDALEQNDSNREDCLGEAIRASYSSAKVSTPRHPGASLLKGRGRSLPTP